MSHSSYSNAMLCLHGRHVYAGIRSCHFVVYFVFLIFMSLCRRWKTCRSHSVFGYVRSCARVNASQKPCEHLISTRGSATAEEPRDALCQLKYYGRFLTELLTRSSANAQEPCQRTVSWNRVKCHPNVQWIAFENVCNRWMTFKVIQGHCRCYHLIGHILFHISLPL